MSTFDPRAPSPGGSAVSSLFSNAKSTAEKAPWANVKVETSVTLNCPACGAPQEVAADFLCRYCHAPMGKRDAAAPSPSAAAPSQSAPAGGAFAPAAAVSGRGAAARQASDRGEPNMTPSQQAIVARWRTFIGKVMNRLHTVLAEADAGCREMIRSNPSDPVPLTNVLSALRARKVNLDKKIYDTWSQQVVQNLADEAAGHAQLAGAVEYKGKVLDQAESEMQKALAWMEDTFEHFRIKWAAESARAMWPLAEQAMKKPVQCTQCGAGLQPRLRHQSDSVTCAACRAVNQVVPEPVVGMYFATAPHAIAEEGAFQKRHAVTTFRRQVEAWRSSENSRTGEWPEEGVESLKQWEALERDYWVTYVALKARLEPMSPEQQKQLIESRMKHLLDDFERNPVWRRAHGLPT
ncbi:MAG: hypothetical protein R3B70_34185 [Polyangiaceae bacterium]